MTTLKQKINSEESLSEWYGKLRSFFLEHKYIQVTASDRRSLAMNSLVYQWYKDIAKSREDVTPQDVRRECKVNYGMTIMRRDPGVDWIYKRTLDALTYEQKLKASDHFQMTSVMSTEELSEYIQAMENDYPWLESI